MNKKISKNKQTSYAAAIIENRAAKLLVYIMLIIIVLIVFIPLVIVFFASFKTNAEYMTSGVFQLPESFLNFENFTTAFVKGRFLTGFKNTTILVVISVFGSCLMGTMVAYALSRFDFRLRKSVLFLFMIPLVVPAITTQVATFAIIKDLHLFNTIWAGVFLYLATDVMQIYILLQHIEKIPISLDESARVEGASFFQIYAKIILPQLKPGIATVIILKTLTVYNDLVIPYLYMPSQNLRTVTTSIMDFSKDLNAKWNIMGAGVILVLIPTILIYLFLQRYIIAGVGDGAVK